MAKMIHISAVSKVLTIHQIVPENKAVKRLEQIRDAFLFLNTRHNAKDRLVVKTGVHNPELPFK